MLASRVGVLGALVAVLVLTVEVGAAIGLQRRMTAVDLRVAEVMWASELASLQKRAREIEILQKELAEVDRRNAKVHLQHDTDRYNDQLIVPNRAGY